MYPGADGRANGLWFDAAVPGKSGGGVEIDAGQSQIHFSAKGNLRPDRGTLQFWVRGKPGANI